MDGDNRGREGVQLVDGKGELGKCTVLETVNPKPVWARE